jgi:hypothetical protein
MRKGQVYILAAAVIIIAIGAIADVGMYSSLPVQKEMTSLSTSGEVMQNINSEIIYTITINETYVDDFLNISAEYAAEKNLNLTFEKSDY